MIKYKIKTLKEEKPLPEPVLVELEHENGLVALKIEGIRVLFLADDGMIYQQGLDLKDAARLQALGMAMRGRKVLIELQSD